ncbi:hypothetical protein PYK79_47290 [Streptomyces sp. ID05-04B]|uniref:hypothetical protein n=1 Tax=Streptomyces sp. ID05-04B TaxID=3028661 RepID=UPI0029C3561B|nr:hypothetical protein [Streptomyces sp. ID05-04B]MDX5569359.1 hypothetical protein [Streptomyces sp. ID05-04B]
MPETTNTLLTAVTELESATFRAGQVARRLLAEHPHLTVRNVSAGLYASAFLDGERSSSARLDVRADGLEAARAWAEALGVEPQSEWTDGGIYVFESARCTATVDGVLIEVSGSRALPPEEAANWRAAGDQGESGED